jgi:hypothetical protein
MDYFPVEITDDGIWVDTGNPISRSQHDPAHITEV